MDVSHSGTVFVDFFSSNEPENPPSWRILNDLSHVSGADAFSADYVKLFVLCAPFCLCPKITAVPREQFVMAQGARELKRVGFFDRSG